MDILGGVLDDARLREVLIAGGYAGAEELDGALVYAKDKGLTLPETLLGGTILTKNLLGQAVAEGLALKFVDSDSLPATQEVAQKIPEAVGRAFRVAFAGQEESVVMVATDQPKREGLLGELQKVFPNLTLEVRYTLPEFITTTLKLYEKSLALQFKDLFGAKTTSIPDIVETIFAHATEAGVSDIHFEPREGEVLVRFRVDGVLLEAGRIPKPLYDRILNRIKVLALLPIDEHMRALDGSLRYQRSEGVVNIRVSIAPTIEGEKIALRLLSPYLGFAIEKLGLSEENTKILEGAARKPFGMILVTGPTGSVKTTMLYAFLNVLNKTEVNITTIEDPVEYKIAGLNQMQTNEGTGLTFARGLRSIVRQDPDVVLVGEIRDRETAEISINAALTGHLLFSTFHSNDAATTIPRLLDMGIEPFLLSSTLELIVAQRLVRKICDNCRTTYALSEKELQKLSPKVREYLPKGKTITLYRG